MSKPQPRPRVARNTGYALATQLIGASLTAIITLYLVRALGPAGFGVLSLALSIEALLALPADFGIASSAARFMAERRSRPAEAAAVLAQAVRLRAALAGVFALLLVALSGPIASLYAAPELAWPLRGIALALFGRAFMLLFGQAFVALGQVVLNLRLAATESVTELAFTIGLVAAGAGVTGAAFGRAAGYLLAGGLGLVISLRLFGHQLWGTRGRSAEDSFPARRLLGYAGAMLVVDAAFTVFTQLDALVIGALLTPAAVGLFQAAMRVAALLHYPGLALATAVAPTLAAGERTDADVERFQRALRYAILLQALITAYVVAWAEPLLGVALGPGYSKSVEVLVALAPFIFLSGAAPLLSLAVNYLGEARRRVPIVIAAVALNLGLDLLLVPEIGVIGGAIGTDAAYALYVPAHLWLCARALSLSMAVPLICGARALVAAGAAGLLMLLAQQHDLAGYGFLLAIAAAVVGLPLYAFTLLIVREASRTEVRHLMRKARMVFRPSLRMSG